MHATLLAARSTSAAAAACLVKAAEFGFKSRLLLRLTSDSIRLLVTDDSFTSALDPKGEFELSTRMRAQRAGKALISGFITHRFGHLTKPTDLTLCMKEGQPVELSKHEELIAKGGEFARLNRVQAQAFVGDSSF